MKRLATIARIAAVASVTCACVLACAWPTRTEADDFDGRQADIGADTTKVGHIQATSRLVEDAKVKGKWYLEIQAKNLSTETQTAELDEQILKESMASMMARSGPIPTVAWKVHEKIQVLPNETAVVRHPLPAWLSQQIAAANAAPKTNKAGEAIIVARASFMTNIQQREVPEVVQGNQQVQVAQAKTAAPRANQAAPQQQARISPQSRARNYSMP
ncbi:MAG: hypothetical protein HY898_19435 [Deltaproteobacteria bacterium]|nr:hypothetical protein [Deltaproteobacteria bacterium]